MPSLPQQVIPAAGILPLQLPTTKGLAVLKITNESVNPMFFCTRGGNVGADYGDIIPANYGSCAYHIVDGDKPPNAFAIRGTATNTFSIYYEEL